MSKPSWGDSDAPDWATALVRQPFRGSQIYCWVESFEDRAKARWCGDPVWQEFRLDKSCWSFVESRP